MWIIINSVDCGGAWYENRYQKRPSTYVAQERAVENPFSPAPREYKNQTEQSTIYVKRDRA